MLPFNNFSKQEIYDCCDMFSDVRKSVILILHFNNLSNSDIRNLKKEDVDLEHRTIKVNDKIIENLDKYTLQVLRLALNQTVGMIEDDNIVDLPLSDYVIRKHDNGNNPVDEDFIKKILNDISEEFQN